MFVQTVSLEICINKGYFLRRKCDHESLLIIYCKNSITWFTELKSVAKIIIHYLVDTCLLFRMFSYLFID